MKIIAFIEDYKIVKKILDYLGIYEFERKGPPPKVAEDPEEFDKYNTEFEKIGSRIDAVSSQYDKVNTTRTRQLLKVVDKISLESLADNHQKLIS